MGVLRVVLILGLLPLLAFCCFGFLASFEPGPNRLLWQLGYGAAIVLILFAVTLLALFPWRRN